MSDQEQAASGRGFTRHVAEKALAPIVASAATAAIAYLMRKGAEIWQERLLPKIEERGGGKAVANDALDSVRERLPDSASEKLESLSSKVTSTEGATTSDAAAVEPDRAEERRKREQRRRQRRRAIEQAGST